MKQLQFLLAIATCIIFLTPVQNASAQIAGQSFADKTPEQKAMFMTMMMKVKLNLDSAQVLKVQPINVKYMTGITALKNNTDGKMAKYKQFKSINKTNQDNLKAVLTPDQYKQYQEMEAEMKEKMKERKESAATN